MGNNSNDKKIAIEKSKSFEDPVKKLKTNESTSEIPPKIKIEEKSNPSPSLNPESRMITESKTPTPTPDEKCGNSKFCGLCKRENGDMIQLACEQFFCRKCITDYLGRNNFLFLCPKCDQPFSPDKKSLSLLLEVILDIDYNELADGNNGRKACSRCFSFANILRPSEADGEGAKIELCEHCSNHKESLKNNSKEGQIKENLNSQPAANSNGIVNKPSLRATQRHEIIQILQNKGALCPTCFTPLPKPSEIKTTCLSNSCRAVFCSLCFAPWDGIENHGNNFHREGCKKHDRYGSIQECFICKIKLNKCQTPASKKSFLTNLLGADLFEKMLNK